MPLHGKDLVGPEIAASMMDVVIEYRCAWPQPCSPRPPYCYSPCSPVSALTYALCSCMILSMLFRHGGGATKEIALRVPLAPAPSAHPTTLLHSVLHWLELATSRPQTATGDAPSSRNGETRETGESVSPSLETQFVGQARADAGISLLRLLCRWVHGCSAAVHELLENPANLFFVDIAAGKEEGGKKDVCAGEVSTGATAAQRASVKGLSCLLLGIMLEFVESAGAAKSGSSSGGGGEWTRDLIMKTIQNRVGEQVDGVWDLM